MQIVKFSVKLNETLHKLMKFPRRLKDKLVWAEHLFFADGRGGVRGIVRCRRKKDVRTSELVEKSRNFPSAVCLYRH